MTLKIFKALMAFMLILGGSILTLILYDYGAWLVLFLIVFVVLWLAVFSWATSEGM